VYYAAPRGGRALLGAALRYGAMVERSPFLTFLAHSVMVLGVLVVAFPLYLAFVASTHTAQEIVQAPMPLLPGSHLWESYSKALLGGGKSQGSTAPVARMMWISLITALVITFGKIAISLMSAFAIVYFRFPFKSFFFWAIFVTLMLPVEVRIGPTYQVVSDLGMLNTYAGLTIPLIASATATFLFRQFFMTVPDELLEAARMDGAGPMRFFKDILLPLSKTSIAALFVIQFIYGWNQYLWPLLATTSEDMYPVVVGIRMMVAGGDAQNEWNVVMATAILALLPPALVVVLMQKWFVKGLVDTEK
jgi:sn-glycerol 3-phosphate transport system permease protein